jgi:hypothetical protein
MNTYSVHFIKLLGLRLGGSLSWNPTASEVNFNTTGGTSALPASTAALRRLP